VELEVGGRDSSRMSDIVVGGDGGWAGYGREERKKKRLMIGDGDG